MTMKHDVISVMLRGAEVSVKPVQRDKLQKLEGEGEGLGRAETWSRIHP